VDAPPRLILGLDASDFLFLLGAIVVWYFVGRAFDRRKVSIVGQRGAAIGFVIHALLLALGVLLLFVGLHDF